MALMRRLYIKGAEIHSSIWASQMLHEPADLAGDQTSCYTSSPLAPPKDESADLHHQCGYALDVNVLGQVSCLTG